MISCFINVELFHNNHILQFEHKKCYKKVSGRIETESIHCLPISTRACLRLLPGGGEELARARAFTQIHCSHNICDRSYF